MKYTALLPLSLLGTFSIFCTVLCDDPKPGNVTDGSKCGVTGRAFVKEKNGLGSTRKQKRLDENNCSTPDSDSFEESFYFEDVSEDTTFYLSSQWLITFVPSIYTVVFTVALPLNMMAILMFLLKIKIKTSAIVFMLNLAIADVLCVAMLPFNIVYRFSGNNWQIGEGMCRFVTAAFYCNMYCSILLMTSISVDRYMAVVFPIHSRSWRTKKRAWLVCVFIWLISIASTMPLLLTKQTIYIDSLDITTCHDVLELKDQQNFYMYYFTAFSSVFFFLPLFITVFCYVKIIRTLSKISKNIEKHSKKTRAILLTIIVLSVFIICFGPTNIIFLMHYLHFLNGYSESLYFTYILCACISSISSCLDPLMYYYASSTYRKYVYSLLCCKSPFTLQTRQSSQTTSSILSRRSIKSITFR